MRRLGQDRFSRRGYSFVTLTDLTGIAPQGP